MTTEKRPVAANDNRPRHVAEFATLAERRDYLEKLPDARYRGTACRIENALVADKSPHAITLRRIRELMRPADIASTVEFDNSGDADEGVENSAEAFGPELKHNQGSFTPSIPKLLGAWADGMRTRVVSKGGRIVGRVGTTYHRDANGETVIVGGQIARRFYGLQFHNGELVAYGDKGKKRAPKYTGTAAGVSYDKDGTDKAYLALPSAAGAITAATNDNAPRSLCPPIRTHRAAKAAALLASAANDNVPITYCPDGLAAEYGRIAGISDSGGTAKAPRHAAFDELERAENFASLGIDPADVAVIETILENASFRAIGLQSGAAESSAHKTGRRIVERVLQKISEKIAA